MGLTEESTVDPEWVGIMDVFFLQWTVNTLYIVEQTNYAFIL